MANNDLTKFFNLMFDKRQTFDIAEGILQDKRGLTGRVSFVGNPVSQPVFIMGSAKDISVNNRCLCIRPKTSAKWIVIGSFGTSQIGYLPQRSPEEGYEIYPPSGIVAGDAIPGACMWSWYAPPEKAVVFEVQTNTTAVESGATTELRTRGSYFIKSSGSNLFLRVRSFQSDYNHSAWSSWYECAPGTGGGGGGSGTVTSVSLTTPTELTTSGSPVTTSGGFTVSWHTQSANKIFAGPSSGSAAVPTFRDQVLDDSPTINTNRLIGRHTAGSGKFEELAIGTGLYIASSTLYASGSGGGSVESVVGGLHINVDNTDPANPVVNLDNIFPLGLDLGGTHTDLSATGGANEFLKQSSSGADITVGAIGSSDLTSALASPPDIGTSTPAKGWFSELKLKIGGFFLTLSHAFTADRTWTFQDSTDTVVGRNTTDTLTNKTLTSPIINTGISGTAIDTDGTLSANSDTLLPSQKAVKTYADQLASGLLAKADVRLATNAALATNVYSNGSSGVGATLTGFATGVLTIDGVTVALNDRVLVKNEVAQENNGIYKCTVAGAVGVLYVLTRATDADTDSELRGGWVFSTEGTINADQGFINSNISAITFGSTAITFGEFSAGAIIAGNGLQKSGNTLSIDTSITVDEATAQILSNKTLITPTVASLTNMQHNHTNAAGGGQITDAALSSAVGIAKGGTGQVTNTAAFDALAPGSAASGDVLVYSGTHWVRLPVGSDGTVLTSNSAATDGVDWEATAATADLEYFGDGSDGTVTISVDTTLTRDMYYDTLTINTGINLKTNGFRVYVKTQLNLNGSASLVGALAASGSGQTGGVGSASGTIGGGASGGAGAAVSNQVGTAGGNGGGLSAGGAGGQGGASAGQASRGAAGSSTGIIIRRLTNDLLIGAALMLGGGGGSGGSSGSAVGGGGGAGATVVFVAARTINKVAAAGTVVSSSGNGATGASGGASTGGGGGGGGGGGTVYLIYRHLIGTGSVNVTSSGGAGGTGGVGVSTGGNGGDSGFPGQVCIADLSSNTFTVTTVGTNNAGSAHGPLGAGGAGGGTKLNTVTL